MSKSSLISMPSLLRLPLAIILLLAIYTLANIQPSAASSPSAAIVMESADVQLGSETRSSHMTTLTLDAPRDTRAVHGGHRRRKRKHYSSRRIYRRRHLHSRTSDASSDSLSSSESVSDSDEVAGRRRKSSAKRNRKNEFLYSQIKGVHNEDEEENLQYGFLPIRRDDLIKLLRTANHSSQELSQASIFVVDADFLRNVALSNAVSPSYKLQHSI